MKKPLFSARELQQVFDAPVARGVSNVSGVAIDSRFVKQDDLFFALRGDHRDGHDFVHAALAAGASLAVVERQMEGAIVVKNSYAALRQLACYARQRCQGTIIGITGSVGKTGIKEALKNILSSSGCVHASEKSFNNRWGLPLTLASLPQESKYALVEMGMNHPGEIRDLSLLTQPDGVVITAIEVGHTAFLGSLSGVARAKMEIFDGLKPGGWAVFPADSPYSQALQEKTQQNRAQSITFGVHPKATVRLCHWSLGAQSSVVDVKIGDHFHHYTVPLPGEHWVMNSTCLLAVGLALGLSPKDIYDPLQNFSPLDGRGKKYCIRLSGGKFRLFDESYNANPASMRAALTVLGLQVPESGKRKIAVLGDMGELGDDAASFHQDLVATIGKNAIDHVFCCGAMMNNLYETLPEHRRGAWTLEAKDLCPLLKEEIKEGDVVLVKGSRSMHMEHIVRFLDNRETV